MSDKHFDNTLRIAIFRGLTKQLLSNNLITQSEYQKISQMIDKEELALIIGDTSHNAHLRQISPKDQVKNGLDSFAIESDD